MTHSNRGENENRPVRSTFARIFVGAFVLTMVLSIAPVQGKEISGLTGEATQSLTGTFKAVYRQTGEATAEYAFEIKVTIAGKGELVKAGDTLLAKVTSEGGEAAFPKVGKEVKAVILRTRGRELRIKSLEGYLFAEGQEAPPKSSLTNGLKASRSELEGMLQAEKRNQFVTQKRIQELETILSMYQRGVSRIEGGRRPLPSQGEEGENQGVATDRPQLPNETPPAVRTGTGAKKAVPDPIEIDAGSRVTE